MSSLISFLVKVNRRGCKVGNRRTGGIAGRRNGFFGIFHDDFFAEGVDKMFGPSGDPYTKRGEGCKFDRITDFIAPEACISCNQKGIISVQFHGFQWDDRRMLLFPFVHREKFIKDPMIYHHEQNLSVFLVLDAKETFIGIIGLHIMHPGTGYQSLKQVSIWPERYCSVEKYL